MTSDDEFNALRGVLVKNWRGGVNERGFTLVGMCVARRVVADGRVSLRDMVDAVRARDVSRRDWIRSEFGRGAVSQEELDVMCAVAGVDPRLAVVFMTITLGQLAVSLYKSRGMRAGFEYDKAAVRATIWHERRLDNVSYFSTPDRNMRFVVRSHPDGGAAATYSSFAEAFEWSRRAGVELLAGLGELRFSSTGGWRVEGGSVLDRELAIELDEKADSVEYQRERAEREKRTEKLLGKAKDEV